MKKETAHHYRQHAEEAELAAEAAQDHETKQFYREIAQRWRETVEQVERQRWWISQPSARL